MRKSISSLLPLALLLLTLVSACGQTPQPLPPSATPTLAAALPTDLPAPTATPAPASLVVCQAEEPRSLYLYAGLSPSAWNVLEALYDGPFDRVGYTAQPVILEKLPALADGDAQIAPVNVQAGEEVVNNHGEVVTLEQGVEVRPAGCDSPECAAAWDGQSALQMDQMTVTFKLLPGVNWSDGTPLTAADSVFSFDIASDPATPTYKNQVDRTSAYRQIDELSVQWTGKPGLLDAEISAYFFLPLPRHLLGTISAADLLQSADAATQPVGWGAYTLEEWVVGDHITLRKNPGYFRAAQGLPKFDSLVFRFISGGQDLLAALQAGECDLIDRSAHLEDDLPALNALSEANKLQVQAAAGPEWEQLVFGIRPSSYDDGYNPAVDRVDLFGDARTRRAFAFCLDRQSVVDTLLGGLSSVPTSFLPGQHPLSDSAAPVYAFDPQEGARLLDEVGWKDSDGSPETPRVAQGIQGVPDGSPLAVSYLTSQASLRQQAGELLARSLAQCGIGVSFEARPMADLFAEGPDGQVFGRQFDLVQFSWESSAQPQCYLYESWRVPSAANQWIGTNISGYASADYDAACERSLDPRADAGVSGQAQQLFAQELPALPLYQLVKVAAARPDLCGLTLDPSARSDLWSLEQIEIGAACAP